METKPADVWCGEDPKIRNLMTQRKLLVPDAPNLERLPVPEFRGKLVGGEAPLWSRLSYCSGVIESVPAGQTDVSAIQGFASYEIKVMGDQPGLDARGKIAGIATAPVAEEGERVREQLALPGDLPVWNGPTKREVRGRHIAVAGDLPLAIAMFAASCTIVRLRSLSPGEHDTVPVTFTIRWQRFIEV